MEVIARANSAIFALIGKQKVNKNLKYRFFSAVVVTEYKNITLYYNNATRELIAVQSNDNVFDYLIEHWFLVPECFDDKKLIDQILNVFKKMTPKNKMDFYEVFTTTDCNARCFYCFEAGMKHKHMTLEIAEKLADRIIEKTDNKNVVIEWFGGEPLYNHSVIDVITKKLKCNNITYRSKMITNGFLFTSKMIEKAKNLWNLKSLQITLDGTEDVYNRCKNYKNVSNISPFRVVTDNIEKLLKADIIVCVRVNFDFHNINNLYQLADYLKTRYGEYKNFHVYAYPLYDSCAYRRKERTDEQRELLIDELIKFENYCIELGITKVNKLKLNFNLNACMPENDNAIVVSADGLFYKCPHDLNEKPWGALDTDDINLDIINAWKIKDDELPNCAHCFNYIDCFRLKKCPHPMVCDNAYRRLILTRLKHQLKRAYDKYTSFAKES